VDPEHVLFLKYEDMIQDPASAIEKVAKFVGVGNDPDTVAKVTHSSYFVLFCFGNMNLLFLFLFC